MQKNKLNRSQFTCENYSFKCVASEHTVLHNTQGSHSLAYKKFQDFLQVVPGPAKRFLGLCSSPAMFYYRQTAVTYSVYTA